MEGVNEWTKRFPQGEWRRLPLVIRLKWWDCTDYSKAPPPPALVAEVETALGMSAKHKS